jgi:hypothetical protein
MPEPSWSRILQVQQEDFIERLKSYFCAASVIHLSCLESVEPCYATSSCELIKFDLREEIELELQRFCEEMYHRSPKGYEPDSLMSWKMGKLGEEAVKLFLGNLINDVDYEIHEGGDGGIDFHWKSNYATTLQVKTTSISRISCRQIEDSDHPIEEWEFFADCWMEGKELIEKACWQLSEKEVVANKIVVFMLLLNPIFGNSMTLGTYNFVVFSQPTLWEAG